MNACDNSRIKLAESKAQISRQIWSKHNSNSAQKETCLKGCRVMQKFAWNNRVTTKPFLSDKSEHFFLELKKARSCTDMSCPSDLLFWGWTFFYFILLTHKRSHPGRSTRNSNPVMKSSTDGAKGCFDRTGSVHLQPTLPNASSASTQTQQPVL